jgi:shikimate dehydrogenase
MNRYAVFGNPIAHSKSPFIHQAFAAQTGEQLSYEKQWVADDGFVAAATNFFSRGGQGLNITVPFKLTAFEFANQLTERAQTAGAVNTLKKMPDGSILGDNTDGQGMVIDMIDNLGWELQGKRVLMLGAGGAVRGVLQPLLKQQPSAIVIANRTVAKALSLVKAFQAYGSIKACGFDDLSNEKFDLIINGTSASLSGELPPLPDNILSSDSACYDMMYGAQKTVFLNWAEQHNCKKLADGLGMLVGQAAESFYLWRGVRPETHAVIERLRADL